MESIPMNELTGHGGVVFTVPEAAKLLRVNSKSLYAAISRGEVPGIIKLGRRLLVPRLMLERMLGLVPLETEATSDEDLEDEELRLFELRRRMWGPR
jgi:excisionase family DNA binding protein